MFHTVLIANRGEIAVRAIKTLKKLGIKSIAVYSETDRYAQHVTDADVAIFLDGIKPSDTYLNIEKLIAAAKQTDAQAIFPGYGFLSESADFSRACEENDIAFMGPTAEQILEFGLKHRARELAANANVPMTPGTGLLDNLDEAVQEATRIGYPIMLKSTAGGGGIGLTRCDDEPFLREAYDSVKRLGEQFFKDAGVFIECFIDQARHVEVQIFGDGQGNVVAFGERDCSLQRRNQKVVEETPAPNLPEATRKRLHQSAIALGESVNYRSAGTVEYIYDAKRDEFYFLEVNTRLQVEHPVTEMVTGLDLIECMLKVASGDDLDWERLKNIQPKGSAIEVRVYAENPIQNFQPSPGTLTEVYFPENARIDTWVKTGTEVSQYFDPMIAKIIVYAEDRQAAIAKLDNALAQTRLEGINTNIDYARHVIADQRFIDAKMWTRMLDEFCYQANVIEVIQAGMQSSIQDYPGRVGYWNIGVPPSGPMDDYAFRLGNQIVGNDPRCAGIEFTLQAPTLKFHAPATIALTGATTGATLDGTPIPFWQPIEINAGQILALGKTENGCRSYLAIRSGLDVPEYLGSRATFALGNFGGHADRTLKAGDILKMVTAEQTNLPLATHAPQTIDQDAIPSYGTHWNIGVLSGPHGAPDFFNEDYLEEFFTATWKVHFNSNRLGVRLVGPKPSWTRENGGEAGLHPSNVHDCEYAIGAINFTGDFPVIIGKDGPSLGGFVCPLTIAKAELWKVGQLRPDDSINFYPITVEQANALEIAQIKTINTLSQDTVIVEPNTQANTAKVPSAILYQAAANAAHPSTVYRQAGDSYILIEYGDNVLDLALRLRVYQLMQVLEQQKPQGILELSPGVRSLQIKYDSLVLPQPDLIALLLEIEKSLGDASTLKVPSRIVHLPMAFEDSATLGAVERYQQSVCQDAPWLPNNVDFIQRINGLATRQEVEDIIFNANYLVLGLGDVYLTAPCAVPIDPRHRLLSSKYNPARTFTAEGTVGIGGMYMCIYGMDSPGGYQLIGRTVPIWNKFKKNKMFGNQQWFLRFFDQIKYFKVSEEELNQWRADFEQGLVSVKIEETEFDFAEHLAFLEQEKDSIDQFKAHQKQAFDTEVSLWANQTGIAEEADHAIDLNAYKDDTAVNASMTGNVWRILVEEGQQVNVGDTVAILEAMKMELAITSASAGVVKAIVCHQGQTIFNGDPLIYLQAS